MCPPDRDRRDKPGDDKVQERVLLIEIAGTRLDTPGDDKVQEHVLLIEIAGTQRRFTPIDALFPAMTR